jgi:hypothetical protein
VVELVVVGPGLCALALEHGQRAEGAGFVDVAGVMLGTALGDQAFALPEELGGLAGGDFGDASEGTVALVALIFLIKNWLY